MKIRIYYIIKSIRIKKICPILFAILIDHLTIIADIILHFTFIMLS